VGRAIDDGKVESNRNRRSKQRINIWLARRFRPNIVVEGAKKPFAEEDWEEITFFNDKGIAYGTTMCVTKCGRCQVS
jgi:uncharacterized protein YcbX